MRILICDDDLLIVEKLQKYLKSYFSHLHLRCPEIVCFSDGESLLADPGDKDILFLDIEMPGLDGIYVGNELKKKEKDIIILLLLLIPNIWMKPCGSMYSVICPSP